MESRQDREVVPRIGQFNKSLSLKVYLFLNLWIFYHDLHGNMYPSAQMSHAEDPPKGSRSDDVAFRKIVETKRLRTRAGERGGLSACESAT